MQSWEMARLANSQPDGPPTRDFGTMVQKWSEIVFHLILFLFSLSFPSNSLEIQKSAKSEKLCSSWRQSWEMARLANLVPAGPPTRDFGTIVPEIIQHGVCVNYLLIFFIKSKIL